MYSLVIPTMWRSDRLIPMLHKYAECKSVKEVMIIDNDSTRRPLCVETIDKVKMFTNGQNNYVNPSWNLGVDLACAPNIALVNDDITFNPIVFDLNPKDNQLIGVHYTCYNSIKEHFDVIAVPNRSHGYGCLMMFKKSSYHRIPESLKVSFGDDYLFHKFEQKSAIFGLQIATEMSTTSKDAEFIAIAEQDGINYGTLRATGVC
jgi:hypothetical protein